MELETAQNKNNSLLCINNNSGEMLIRHLFADEFPVSPDEHYNRPVKVRAGAVHSRQNN